MRRRDMILATAGAAGVGLGIANHEAFAAMTQAPSPKTFVLVHGAWHGGWCWRLVEDRLRGAGHRVYCPTLTGMGEREHIGTPETGLHTHIEDVLAVLRFEELSDIILVGHSYGGPVCEGVYDKAADQIAKLIMLDAALQQPGNSMISKAPPEMIKQTEASLIEGYKVPVWPPESFAVLPEDGPVYDWLKRRLTTMPYGSLTQPLILENASPTGPDVLYIQCTGRPYAGNSDYSVNIARERGWTVQTIDTGHDAMVTAPETLAQMLLEAA